jgi:hypothetical protein
LPDGKFFPLQSGMRMIQFIQNPDGQIHVNIFRIERSEQDAHVAKVEYKIRSCPSRPESIRDGTVVGLSWCLIIRSVNLVLILLRILSAADDHGVFYCG